MKFILNEKFILCEDENTETDTKTDGTSIYETASKKIIGGIKKKLEPLVKEETIANSTMAAGDSGSVETLKSLVEKSKKISDTIEDNASMDAIKPLLQDFVANMGKVADTVSDGSGPLSKNKSYTEAIRKLTDQINYNPGTDPAKIEQQRNDILSIIQKSAENFEIILKAQTSKAGQEKNEAIQKMIDNIKGANEANKGLYALINDIGKLYAMLDSNETDDTNKQELQKAFREYYAQLKRQFTDKIPRAKDITKTDSEPFITAATEIIADFNTAFENTLSLLGDEKNKLEGKEDSAKRADDLAAKKGKKDWTTIFREAGDNFAKIEAAWNDYYKTEFGELAPKIKSLGHEFTKDVIAYGFDEISNPLITFVRRAFNDDASLNPAIYTDISKLYKDIRLTKQHIDSGLDGILYDQGFLSSPGKAEVLKIYDEVKKNLKVDDLANDGLRKRYADGDKVSTQIVKDIITVEADPFTGKHATAGAILRSPREMDAIFNSVFPNKTLKAGQKKNAPNEAAEIVKKRLSNDKGRTVKFANYLAANTVELDPEIEKLPDYAPGDSFETKAIKEFTKLIRVAKIDMDSDKDLNAVVKSLLSEYAQQQQNK